MWKSYFKIAIRNIWKHRTQSLVSILGLAFAIACFVPAFYWMKYETSYDTIYPNVYRVYAIDKQSGQVNKGLSKVYETTLRAQFPMIESSTVFINGEENCQTDQIPYIHLKMIYADSSFFHVFPQKVLLGNSLQPLPVLNNIVLTESCAIRLFGNIEQAMGQKIQNTIRTDMEPYTVTAIVKDPPADTNLPFQAIVNHGMLKSFNSIPAEAQWGMFLMDTYIRLNPQAHKDELIAQLPTLLSKQGIQKDMELRILPIKDVRYQLDSETPFTINFINLFVVSGVLLVCTALFNFLSLNFSLFKLRVREIHLRMVNGASARQLISQLMFELGCSVALALLASLYFVLVIRTPFASLLNIQIEVNSLLCLFAICSLAIILIIGIFSFFIFRNLIHFAIRPISQRETTKHQSLIKKTAIVSQLAISITFIVATGVVTMQMHFINQKDLGFDRHGIIQLTGFQDYSGKVESTLKDKLATIPQIESITDASFKPQHHADPFTVMTDITWEGKNPQEQISFDCVLTDEHFAETFHLKMLQGSWWKEGQPKKVVLNEEAVRMMGLQDPIGKVIRMPSPSDGTPEEYEIAGVVNNFHMLSFRNHIRPNLFVPSPMQNNILYIRVVQGEEWNVIEQVAKLLPTIDASLGDASVTPIDNLYKQLNQSEQVGLKMFTILAIVCLLISLIGIYALSVATTEQRQKEIAIRKILGALPSTILYTFVREYMLYVLIACVLAFPIAFWGMNLWLQNYAYRIHIPWYLWIGITISIIGLVLSTIWVQIMKVVNENPADVIKRN